MNVPPRTYHIWTIGCQMNKADSRYVAAELESMGYVPTPNAAEADLLLLNTCVVRQQAEDKAIDRLQQIKGIKRRRPGTVVALAGCMVGRKFEAGLRERFPFVDVFMGPSDLQPLINHLASSDPGRAGPSASAKATADRLAQPRRGGTPRPTCGGRALPPSQEGRAVTAEVPIILGCSHHCTFCVIPGRRGPERSRPMPEILDELRRLAAQGVREVVLLGQIVDRYGLDLRNGSDLPGLLREAAAIERLARIRFLTSHPGWMSDALIEAVATVPKVCPCIEVPIQAGNDEILEKMKRGYTSADYRRLVDRIRSRVPGVAIHTDIIVGFPGETEAQFMDTCRLMAEVPFDMGHIAKYSQRPMTVAAQRFRDDVPEEEKERRRVLLEDLLAQGTLKKNRELIGRSVEVLVEEKGSNGKWRSRTPQNRLVFFEDPRDLRGRIVTVLVESVQAFSLFGRAT